MELSVVQMWEKAKEEAAKLGLDLSANSFGDKFSVRGDFSENTFQFGFYFPFFTVKEVQAFLVGYKCAMEQKAKQDATAFKEQV
jgi:hypothetical protein